MITKTNEEFNINQGNFEGSFSITFKNKGEFPSYSDLVIKDEDNEDVLRESFDVTEEGLMKLKCIKAILDETIGILEERL